MLFWQSHGAWDLLILEDSTQLKRGTQNTGVDILFSKIMPIYSLSCTSTNFVYLLLIQTGSQYSATKKTRLRGVVVRVVADTPNVDLASLLLVRCRFYVRSLARLTLRYVFGDGLWLRRAALTQILSTVLGILLLRFLHSPLPKISFKCSQQCNLFRNIANNHKFIDQGIFACFKNVFVTFYWLSVNRQGSLKRPSCCINFQ